MNTIYKYVSQGALVLGFLSAFVGFSGVSYAAKAAGKGKTPPAAASVCEKPEKSVQALFEKFLNTKDNSLSWVCTVDKVVKTFKDSKCTKYDSLLKELQSLRNEKNSLKILTALQGRGAFLDLLLNEKTAKVLDTYSKLQAINLVDKRLGLNGKASC